MKIVTDMNAGPAVKLYVFLFKNEIFILDMVAHETLKIRPLSIISNNVENCDMLDSS